MQQEVTVRLAQTNRKIADALERYKKTAVDDVREQQVIQQLLENLTNRKTGHENSMAALQAHLGTTLHTQVRIVPLQVAVEWGMPSWSSVVAPTVADDEAVRP